MLLAASETTLGPTLAIIVGVGMAAQWIAWRTQIPSIILLLLAGLVLGPVAGVVDPDEFLGGTLFPIVSLSVALILFEGGLDLPPRELRATGTVVRRLITLGAIITFFVGVWGAEQLFDISRGAAAVMAAVLVVTGPTVVGPLLRFVRPSGRTGPMLRAEGILIDPIGATAALVAFEAALTNELGEALIEVLGVIGLTLVAGFGIGFVSAWVLDHAMRRFLIPDYLGNPMAVAAVVVAFVLSNWVQEEAGLLTVTVMGIWLARRDSAAVRQLLEFNESLRTLLISALFILLAARIETDQLQDVALPALAFLALLVFVARPLSVIVSTIRTSLTWRERLFLMVMAPRGIVAAAVSAIFALRLEEEGVRGAELIVPVVFLVIIGTILVYGFLAGPTARRLGLADQRANGVLIVGAHSAARGFAKALDDLGVRALLVDTDPYNVTRSVALGLPARRVSVLTEEATHELDLRGIGRILALTSNDEVNALASSRFARVFGRRETFQLAPSEKRRRGALPEELLGRIIGIDGLEYGTIDERVRQGWRVRSAPAGESIAASTEGGLFFPMARVFDGQLSFICRNDPVPTQGAVVGLAAPSVQQELDADVATAK
ncbi:MAG: cation:proton antiporter [Ilumatobacter sp.]|uniref:cation:proton antiporter n=1 Tax=Ilumatobacter sp. TaxID=1967498 RepID=UPI00260C5736|nr:cation:proton antiporter [Ilumatobacter sp.]MDJ0769786.1 cation:proton antiporter [Ilumatobacter sp.]